jgi:hypothetical protein
MPGMRGNGLSARAYVAVADLDPSTADTLLARLRDRGVAAYAAVSPDSMPTAAEQPDRPELVVDRLYVDVDAEASVRLLIDQEILGGFDETDGTTEAPAEPYDDDARERQLDEDFRSIIAGFDSPTLPALATWPAAEDLDDLPGAAGSGPAAGTFGALPAGPASGGPASGGAIDPASAEIGDPSRFLSWEDALRPSVEPAQQAQPEADRYVPPPPPPLPRARLGVRLAWVAAIGGPAVLFAAVIFNWELENWELLLAVVAFLGGFVALVAQLNDSRDDDGDDGAVV